MVVPDRGQGSAADARAIAAAVRQAQRRPSRPGWSSSASAMPLDLASLKAQLRWNTSAPISTDAFGSLLSSLKLGGSVALTVVGNAVLIPVALVLPAAGLEALRAAGAGAGAAARPAGRGLLHRRSRPGAGPVPARPIAGDADDGASSTAPAWRCSAWTWRCRSASSPAWPCSCPMWASGSAWCSRIVAGAAAVRLDQGAGHGGCGLRQRAR